MEYEKYKVFISEKAKNMLASNIAFIAKVSGDAATKQKKAVFLRYAFPFRQRACRLCRKRPL